MNDSTRTAEEKIQFYFNNRRVMWEYSELFKVNARAIENYVLDMEGRFESEAEMEYYLDQKYINDDYEVMDYGRNQKLFNMYRRYNELQEHANDNVIKHLSYVPKSNYKLREHKDIMINKKDIKLIREVRKNTTLTVPQIEVLFGLIFFCRMYDTENANLNTEFKKKQFLGCFEKATIKDLNYVASNVLAIEETEDGDYIYHPFSNIELEDEWIHIPVTKANNRLNLTKMAHKYITDIADKRYCKMCSKPFKPTNNRQQVCEECKPKSDEIKAKLRKTKQRFIQKNGKDACCGKCTDCIRIDCDNWWEYWYNEMPCMRNMTDVQREEEINKMIYNIQNVYTKEEKSEIRPWDMIYKYKRY
jgi:hypothetical protein